MRRRTPLLRTRGTQGRWLWTRPVGSTVTGQAVEYSGPDTDRVWGSAASCHVAADDSLGIPDQGGGRGGRHASHIPGGWMAQALRVNIAFDRRTNFNPFTWQAENA